MSSVLRKSAAKSAWKIHVRASPSSTSHNLYYVKYAKFPAEPLSSRSRQTEWTPLQRRNFVNPCAAGNKPDLPTIFCRDFDPSPANQQNFVAGAWLLSRLDVRLFDIVTNFCRARPDIAARSDDMLTFLCRQWRPTSRAVLKRAYGMCLG